MMLHSRTAHDSSTAVDLAPLKETSDSLQKAARNGRAYDRLRALCDTFGHRFALHRVTEAHHTDARTRDRLSGTRALEDAIGWFAKEMAADGLQNVHVQPVKVPHWVGAE
jgi:hypothetical protein